MKWAVYIESARGGAAKTIFPYVQALAAEHEVVRLVHADHDPEDEAWISQHLGPLPQVLVRIPPRSAYRVPFVWPSLDPLVTRDITRALVSERVEAVLVNQPGIDDHQVVLRTSSRLGLPTVTFVHIVAPDLLSAYRFRTIKIGWASHLYGSLARILTANEVNLKTLTTQFGVAAGRIGVVRSGVADVARPRTPPGRGEILCAGRFAIEKGHVLLIRALGWMRARCPDLPWRLTLVGDGPERSRIQDEIARFGLGDRVEFHGWTATIDRFLARTDLFVLPSLFEAAPLVLLEAMMWGVPILATRSYGIPEMVREGESGLLFAREDAEDLGRALQAMLEDSEGRERMGRRGREIYEANHTLEHARGSFMAQIRKALSPQGADGDPETEPAGVDPGRSMP